jgi:hypothetical protein
LRSKAGHDRAVLKFLMRAVRGLGLIVCGHRDLVLENVALRQQLATMHRAQERVSLQTRDRLFWIALASAHRAFQYYGASDGDVGHSTSRRSLSDDTAPRWLHRDRDSIYSERFRPDSLAEAPTRFGERQAFAFRVTPDLLAVGVAYALAMGLIGGLLPAIRAARLPIPAALRDL